jgi:hypothetical protein
LILRFGAKMISNIRENNDRVFNISYHLADDTISVFELPCRNFGFVAGEFIGKAKFYLPGQEKYTAERPVPYTSQHFYLGATLILRDFCFKIVSADLFALKFMEDNKELVKDINVSFEQLQTLIVSVPDVARTDNSHEGSRSSPPNLQRLHF